MLHTLLFPSSANNSTLKNTLFKLCKQELNLLASGTCVKFRHLAEQMLEDPVVQKAQSPLMQEFKRNVTDFLQNYPILMKYGLDEQLLQIFYQMAFEYYHQEHSKDKDSQYILDLLRRFRYDQIHNDYVIKFNEVVHKILLPKIEEVKNSNTNKETKQWEKVLKSANELKECKALLTSEEQRNEIITQEFQDLNIIYAHNATLIATGILTDPRLSNLSSSEQQHLSLDLKVFIQQYESNRDVNQLTDLLNTFDRNVVFKYFKFGNVKNLDEDQLLLKEIYREQGLANFEIERGKRFNRFVERLFKKFERFKESLNREELVKEKTLLDWLENFKRLTQY